MFWVYFALWIVFNGRFTWEIAAFGVVIAAAVYFFSVKFLGYDPKKERAAARCFPQILSYVWLLFVEIVKANLALIRFVYSPKKVEPALVTFRTPLHGAKKSVLADSITVTPGTISVESQGDTLTVHCLDKSLAEGIEDLEFQRQLAAMKGEEE